MQNRNKILVGLLLFVFHANAQNIDISQDWKFEFGDKPEWALLQTDDSKWKNMAKLGYVEHLGYPDYAGFAWFRKKIIIPSSLKANAEKYGFVNLVLGGIDDSDQGFFNGKMVGESGKLPPDKYVQGFYQFRNYIIDPKNILWDKENIIAVRLYDDAGDGGFYSGPYLLSVPEGEALKLTNKSVEGYPLTETKQSWSKIVKLPTELKAKAEKNNGIKLNTNLPGEVGVFVNNKFIVESTLSKKHSIFIPNSFLNWDKDNEFIFYISKAATQGEILFSDMKLTDASWADGIKVKIGSEVGNTFEASKPIAVELEVSNVSGTDFKGSISIELASDVYKIEANSVQILNLAKGKTEKVEFKHTPNFSGAFKIDYRITDSNTGFELIGNVANGFIK